MPGVADLRWNDLGPEGGRALAEAVQRHSVLCECHVGGNRISDAHVMMISGCAAAGMVLAGLTPAALVCGR